MNIANAQATTTVRTLEDVQGILQDVVGWAQVFFYVIAALFIIWGAWDYLQSGGEPEKTKKARDRILYSLVAIAIAVIAGGIVRMVASFINTP
ncbi:MAG: hypothetical protein Q8R20_00410 [Nanoarchaeota archaeon]|nr:hypothetical protein [Nanoarchaeota archaeon]